MIIINGGSDHMNSQGEAEIKRVKQYLYDALKNTPCPNNCKRDMLIRLQYHNRKKLVIADIYGPCCEDFEAEIKPYLRPF